jgi:ActR/RegA family two-component response regulator
VVAAADGRRRSVLVCDPDRHRAVTIGALVGLRRHAIRIAHSVADARAECLRSAPDVLVFELSLGVEAAESLSAWLSEHAPAVRRIFVCGTAAEALAWLERRIAHHTLLRPLPIQDLWTFVESH